MEPEDEPVVPLDRTTPEPELPLPEPRDCTAVLPEADRGGVVARSIDPVRVLGWALAAFPDLVTVLLVATADPVVRRTPLERVVLTARGWLS